jgi:hypothetical protein
VASWPITTVSGPKAALPNAWSKWKWVSTTYRIGRSLTVLTASIKQRAPLGDAPESTTSTASSPTTTTELVT